MPVDYRTLYQEEPIRFRGLGVLPQGQSPCGVSTVGPMPGRKAPVPKAFRGLRGNLSGAELKSTCNVPDASFNQTQLLMGIPVEMEHTVNLATATCIAKHHLLEEAKARGVPLDSKRLSYYTDLAKMESRWGKRGLRRVKRRVR